MMDLPNYVKKKKEDSLSSAGDFNEIISNF